MALSPPLHLSVRESGGSPWQECGLRIGGLELKYSIDFLDVFLVRDPDIESKLFCVDKFSLRTYVVRNVPDRQALFFPALAFTCVSVGRSASFPLAKSIAENTGAHAIFHSPSRNTTQSIQIFGYPPTIQRWTNRRLPSPTTTTRRVMPRRPTWPRSPGKPSPGMRTTPEPRPRR